MLPRHGRLTIYIKLRIEHAPGCRECFLRYRLQRKPLVSVMHVGIANPRWRRKRSRHTQRMFNVSGKRPIQMDGELEYGWLIPYIILPLSVIVNQAWPIWNTDNILLWYWTNSLRSALKTITTLLFLEKWKTQNMVFTGIDVQSSSSPIRSGECIKWRRYTLITI